MIKKIIKHFWQYRDQFIKYSLIGSSAVFLDLLSLFVLKEYFGLNPVLALKLNQVFLIIYVFFLNKFWTFQSNGLTHRQLIRFIILNLANYVFAIAWMWFWYNLIGFNGHYHYMFIRIINIGIAVSWNFILYKHWIYKPLKKTSVDIK